MRQTHQRWLKVVQVAMSIVKIQIFIAILKEQVFCVAALHWSIYKARVALNLPCTLKSLGRTICNFFPKNSLLANCLETSKNEGSKILMSEKKQPRPTRPVRLCPKTFPDPASCSAKPSQIDDIPICTSFWRSVCPYSVLFEMESYCWHASAQEILRQSGAQQDRAK